MKRLLTILLLIVSANVFGQKQPQPSGTLTPLTTNQAYFRASDSTYYFYNGTNYLWNYFLNKQQADKLYQPINSPSATPFSLSTGYGLVGSSFDGSVARTWTADTASAGGLVSKSRLATNLGGYVPSSRTITINGATRDLSANRTFNVGTVVSVGATAGTGISISGSPITSSGNITISNTFPTSTGLKNGGNITGVGDAFPDVSAGSGVIYDNTDPANPTYTVVNFNAVNDLSVTSNATNYITVNSAGVVSASTTAPTESEYRTKIYLGRVAKNGSVVRSVAPEPYIIQNIAPALGDLYSAIGMIKDGLTISAVGANKQIAVASGGIDGYGINFQTSPTAPNRIVYSSQSPQTFRMVTQTGAQGGDTLLLPVGFYDNGGVITAIPGSSNRASIFTVYKFGASTGNVRIFYGQSYYNSLAEAFTALSTYTPIVPAVYKKDAVVIGYIIAQAGATALNDSTQAQFVETNKFGGVGGAIAANLTNYVQKSGDTMTGTLNGTDIVLSDNLQADTVKGTAAIFNSSSKTLQVQFSGANVLSVNSTLAGASAPGSVYANTLISGATQLSNLTVTNLNAGGLIKAVSPSGSVGIATAGTDYLAPGTAVLLTGNQSIAGQKTFSDVTTFSTTVTSSTPAGFYTLQGSGISTDFSAIDLRNGSGTTRFGTEGNSGNKVFTGSTNNASIFGSSTNTPIEFGLNGTIKAAISTAGSISSTPQGTLYGTATGSITSAQLSTSLSDETGTGNAVFSASPTFTGTVNAASATLSSDLRVNGIYRDYQGEALIQTTTGADTQIGSLGAGTPRSFRVYTGNATALTISTSQTATFSGAINGTSASFIRDYAGNPALSVFNTSSTGNGLFVKGGAGSDYAVYVTDYIGESPFFEIKGNGNTLLGGASDESYTLNVNGSGKFSSSVAMATSSGGVLIGTTTSNGSPLGIEADSDGDQIYLKRSAANAQIYMGGTTGAATELNIRSNGSGGVVLTSGATGWASISDENTKVMSDFVEFSSPLSKISNLRAGISRYKTDPDSVKRAFLIAQDVQKVLPEAVSVSENGILSLRYSDVIPLLVGAIKELKLRIETLEK